MWKWKIPTWSKVIMFISLLLTALVIIFVNFMPIYEAVEEVSIDLWVDGFDNTRTGWNRYGLEPYLDAQDYPENFVNSSVLNDQIGDFSFQNIPSGAETLINVTLYFYGYSYMALEWNKIYLYDGATWTYIGKKSGAWGWISFDVSNILNSFEKINNAKLYLERYGGYGYEVAADAAYLLVYVYAAPIPSGIKASEYDAYGYCTNTTYEAARNNTKAIQIVSDVYQIKIGQDTSYSVYRGFLVFDTNFIPDVIENITIILRIYVEQVNISTLVIQYGRFVWPYIPIRDVDYNFEHYMESIELTPILGWNNITLPAKMLFAEGYTTFCLRSKDDVDNIAPTGDQTMLIASGDALFVPLLDVSYDVKKETKHYVKWVEPISIQPATYGTWSLINISGLVPEDVNFVFLRIHNTGTSAFRADFRPYNTDWDDYACSLLPAGYQRYDMMYVHIHARTFEAKVQDASINIQIVGYACYDAVFLRTPKWKNVTEANVWEVLSVSKVEDEVWDAAKAIILKGFSSGTLVDLGVRPKGSTIDCRTKIGLNQHRYFVVPINEAGEFEAFGYPVYGYFKLVGYFRHTLSIFNVQNFEQTFITAGWQTINFTDYVGHKDFHYVWVHIWAGATRTACVRPYGSTLDLTANIYQQNGFFCGVEDGSIDVYINGDSYLIFILYGIENKTLNLCQDIYYFKDPPEIDATNQWRQVDVSQYIPYDSSFVLFAFRHPDWPAPSSMFNLRPHFETFKYDVGTYTTVLEFVPVEVRNGIIEQYTTVTYSYLFASFSWDFLVPVYPRINLTDALPYSVDETEEMEYPTFYLVKFNVSEDAVGMLLKFLVVYEEDFDQFAIRLPGDTAWNFSGVPDAYARKVGGSVEAMFAPLNGTHYAEVQRTDRVQVYLIGEIKKGIWTYAQDVSLPHKKEWQILDLYDYSGLSEFVVFHTWSGIEEPYYSFRLTHSTWNVTGSRHFHPWLAVRTIGGTFEFWDEATGTGRIWVYGFYRFVATELKPGWNKFNAWLVDVGHTLGEINSSIQRDGIEFKFIVLRYTNGTEYVFIFGYIINKDVVVLSTEDILFVYVTVEGYWAHVYE